MLKEKKVKNANKVQELEKYYVRRLDRIRKRNDERYRHLCISSGKQYGERTKENFVPLYNLFIVFIVKKKTHSLNLGRMGVYFIREIVTPKIKCYIYPHDPWVK